MDTILPLGVSRLAGAFTLAAGGATLLLLALTPLGPWTRALLVLAIAVASLSSFRALAMRKGARVPRRLVLKRAGELEVEDDLGRHTGMIQGGSFVAPWLTLIRWRPVGSRWDRTVVILPDMVPEEEFRAARLLLRWSSND